MRKEKQKTAVIMPIKSTLRKFPFIFFQKTMNPSVFKLLRFFRFIELMDRMSSLYTPRISAIVPPETPGIRSAVPMATPLKNNVRFFENKFFKG